jgi:hypothetical protein
MPCAASWPVSATRLARPGAAKLVLLSLTPPGWPEDTWTSPAGNRWTWLSYARLSAELRPALPAVTAADACA